MLQKPPHIILKKEFFYDMKRAAILYPSRPVGVISTNRWLSTRQKTSPKIDFKSQQKEEER